MHLLFLHIPAFIFTESPLSSLILIWQRYCWKIIGIETHHWAPITFPGPVYSGKLLFIDEAVQSGWWLAPISSNDSYDYRNVPGESRIGVVAEEFSHKAIFLVLKKRMTFASSFPIQLFASALLLGISNIICVVTYQLLKR